MKHIMGPSSRSSLTNVKEGDVQPNAVDLRLGKVFRMSSSTFRGRLAASPGSCRHRTGSAGAGRRRAARLPSCSPARR